MGTNHSLCWSLLFGLALRQVAAPLYTVESFSPYNSTLQTNDCKACALLQRLSNFLLIFHNFSFRTHPESLRSRQSCFRFFYVLHIPAPRTLNCGWVASWRHTRIFTLRLFLLGREVEDVVGHENGFFENLFNFGGEKEKRKTNKSGPFPIVLLRKTARASNMCPIYPRIWWSVAAGECDYHQNNLPGHPFMDLRKTLVNITSRFFPWLVWTVYILSGV